MDAAPNSFQARKRALDLSYARELLIRSERLRTQVQTGRYEETHLVELRAIIRAVRDHLTGNDTRISEISGLSGSTIASIYKGRGYPKFSSFMMLLNAAIKICEKIVGGDIGADEQLNLEPTSFSGHWPAEWITLNRQKIQNLITQVIESIEQICVLARGTNVAAAGESLSGLTEIQRNQLISVLEVTLSMLKSPMVEVGLLRRLGTSLRIIARRSVEREATNLAADQGSELLDNLINNIP